MFLVFLLAIEALNIVCVLFRVLNVMWSLPCNRPLRPRVGVES